MIKVSSELSSSSRRISFNLFLPPVVLSEIVFEVVDLPWWSSLLGTNLRRFNCTRKEAIFSQNCITIKHAVKISSLPHQWVVSNARLTSSDMIVLRGIPSYISSWASTKPSFSSWFTHLHCSLLTGEVDTQSDILIPFDVSEAFAWFRMRSHSANRPYWLI